MRADGNRINNHSALRLFSFVYLNGLAFNTQVAVDKAKKDLPDDLLQDPAVIELDMSELPIVTFNLSGNYNTDELKEYSDYLQDKLEKISEVSKVNISGLSEKEVQVNLDMHKMKEMQITFKNIENAIKYENITMSAGDIKIKDQRKSVRIVGEFESIDEIKNIIIKSENGKNIYLRDVAEVIETYADTDSYTRLNNNPVVSLQIVKKNGENLIEAVEKSIFAIEEAKQDGHIPENLEITITNNQSVNINKMINNLENSIFMGIILVVLILLLFLGLRNAVIVGFSIPMSMLLSFVVLNALGKSINMMTLFSMILALGMLVDNAIVVVENIYRFIEKGYKIKEATRQATSEVAGPIIASTLTTLVAFFPLIFWSDLMGQFMKLLPITLIIVLTSSLVNALLFTPVLAKIIIKKTDEQQKPKTKKTLFWAGGLIIAAIPLYLIDLMILANFLIAIVLTLLLYTFVLYKLSLWFQNKFLTDLEKFYKRFIKFSLRGKNPARILGFVTILLFITLFFYFGVRKPKMILFPENEPTSLNIYTVFPYGVDIDYTDSIMKIIEVDLNNKLEPYSDIVESVLINVGSGVREKNKFSVGKNFNLGQFTVNFVDYEFRDGINTSEIISELSDYFKNRYPGISFKIEKNKMRPPSGKPIQIELKGEDFDKLISLSDSIIYKVENSKIPGIENLIIDIETNKPNIIIHVDKNKAGRFGLTTAQIASSIRTSIYGTEASKYKSGDDEYPIMLRFAKNYRNNLNTILNQDINFRNSKGKQVNIPISAVASISMNNSYDAIKHIDTKRTLTISSNVIEGYNANQINNLIKTQIDKIEMPEGYSVKFGGEQEDMKESMSFLSTAMLIAIVLILVILVTQFNSVIKPLIIIASVGLSTIGVFGGLATFNMDFVVIMTGIGMISLAGIVVNNAIVLIDYIDFLKLKRKKELGLDEDDNLPIDESIACIEEAGQTRLRPVLLTAITTILGLITLAIGLNFDFAGLFSNLAPNIYVGGDNVGFWGPMSWTVIFGLAFATFMTLIVVPAMYLIGNRIKLKFAKN
ncbi:MAG: efflux RND transporter permease subunit [Bacteroidota bacterium]|nr:efflux RND transporter permease subunit [Bacteroidota bacterium]